MFNMPESHAFKKNYNVWVSRRFEPVYPVIHTHDFYEITYVIRGEGIHIINNEELPVKKGDLFFINIGTSHSYRAYHRTNLQVFNCVFRKNFYEFLYTDNQIPGSAINDFLPPSLTARSYIRLTEMENAEPLLTALHAEINNKGNDGDFFETIYNGLLCELLNEMVEEYKNVYPPTDIGEIMDSAAIYIQKNYTNNLTTQNLCEVSHLSPSHFCRCFKKHFGITASEYIIRCRINAACRMLETSAFQINHISSRVGYKSESFFRNSFKKLVGMSPGEYRRCFVSGTISPKTLI